MSEIVYQAPHHTSISKTTGVAPSHIKAPCNEAITFRASQSSGEFSFNHLGRRHREVGTDILLYGILLLILFYINTKSVACWQGDFAREMTKTGGRPGTNVTKKMKSCRQNLRISVTRHKTTSLISLERKSLAK